MSYGLVFGAIVAFLFLAVLIGGLVWWVQRPLSARHEDGPRVQPLFGNDRASVYSRHEDQREYAAHDAEADDDKAHVMAARMARTHTAPATAAGPPGASEGRPSAHATVPPSTTKSPWAPRTAPSSHERARSHHGRQHGAAAAAMRVPAPAASNGRPDALLRQVNVAQSAAAATASLTDGRAVRFTVPADRTLQFLPGRLDAVGGLDAGREVRFVRLPDEDAVVTFGRLEGQPYRHVQLADPTVSRSHARLRFAAGRWYLTNLSTTNPVLQNSHSLTVDVESLLEDGDRVEMGEVVFRFRA